MITLTLIIPKDRDYYHNYILFLSKLQTEYKFKIASYNDQYDYTCTKLDTDYALILTRYCYINFNKLNKLIQKILHSNIVYCTSNHQIILSKTKYLKKYKNLYEFIDSLKSDDHHVSSLNRYCYLNNTNIIGSMYHNATFACLDDTASDFTQWIEEYHNHIKIVFYKGERYILKLGKNFFIKNNIHIAKLPNKIIIYWNTKHNRWQIANKTISGFLNTK